MKYFKFNDGVGHLKTGMGVITSPEEINVVPGQTVAQAKADGEFTYISYNNGGVSYTVNKNGYRREDFPALNEMAEILGARMPEMKCAEFRAEVHAVEDGHPQNLPTFIHFAKGGNPDNYPKVHIGLFDWMSVDGTPLGSEGKVWIMTELAEIFKDAKMVYPLPFIIPKTRKEAVDFWNKMVNEAGYEGLVVTIGNGSGEEVFKVKQLVTLDAVVIGINKTKQTKKNMASSLKLALMKPDGTFIEVGNAAGIEHKLQKAIWEKLVIPHLVHENKHAYFIEPIVVVEVEVTEIWKNNGSTVWKWKDGKYEYLGSEPFVSLRHPRFDKFRPDKEVNLIDLRLNQVPEKFLVEEE